MKRQISRQAFLDALAPWRDSPLAAYEGTYHEARASLLRDFEAAYVAKVVSSVGGNLAHAARKAGIERRYLYELLEKHGFRARRPRESMIVPAAAGGDSFPALEELSETRVA